MSASHHNAYAIADQMVMDIARMGHIAPHDIAAHHAYDIGNNRFMVRFDCYGATSSFWFYSDEKLEEMAARAKGFMWRYAMYLWGEPWREAA